MRGSGAVQRKDRLEARAGDGPRREQAMLPPFTEIMM